MTFEFQLQPTLPLLSWCARVRPGAPVQVRHGAGVETRPEGFVEGAWDGEFDAFDFDRSSTLAGTGARLGDGRVSFAAPFHPLERLFVLRRGVETLVSNSLVFLLAEARDSLSLSHPHYFFELLRHARAGILAPASLPTAAGHRVQLFRCCLLVLHPDGALHREPQPLGPPPASYADYFASLDRITKAVALNASARSRSRTYRLVAACSRGYDSTATAAIASLAGCREGVTFVGGSTSSGHPLLGLTDTQGDDSGADTLRTLGMSVTEYQRVPLSQLPGFPTAEFFLTMALTDRTTQVMEQQLRASLFVSGRHGERYWGPTARCSRRNFKELDDCTMSGHALAEFRLRTGFLHFPIAYIGALHGPAIYRITHAPEMLPWKLGTGYYDRPIARRIAEEAGVPRSNFGHRKFGAGVGSSRVLNPESERDFQAFLKSEVPAQVLRRLDPRPLSDRVALHRKLAYVRTQYAHLPFAATMLDVFQSDRLHMMWNSTRLYHFHWGFFKTRPRYE